MAKMPIEYPIILSDAGALRVKELLSEGRVAIWVGRDFTSAGRLYLTSAPPEPVEDWSKEQPHWCTGKEPDAVVSDAGAFATLDTEFVKTVRIACDRRTGNLTRAAKERIRKAMNEVADPLVSYRWDEGQADIHRTIRVVPLNEAVDE